MRVICSLVAVVMAIGVGMRAAEAGPNGVVLESWVGERPADAEKLLAPLIQEMRRRKYTMGTSLGQDFEAAISKPSGTGVRATFDVDVDSGLKLWAQGKFDLASDALQPLIDEARANATSLIAKPKLRDAYLKALVGVALSKQRLGDPLATAEAFDEIIRSFPAGGVTSSTYGPQAANDFAARKKQKLADPKGHLVIKADDDTEVFINEQLERKGIVVKDLVPGTYRVVARLGTQLSRVHRVEVRAGSDATIEIDPAFDSAVQTTGWAGFAFADAADRKDHEALYAGKFGKSLDAAAVVIVSVDQSGRNRALVGAIVQLNGVEIRRASLALTASPSPQGFENLARFLVGENVTEGLEIERNGTVATSGGGGSQIGPGPGPERPSTPKSRWVGWPVLTAVVALGGAGVSAYYLSKDGDCKDGSTNPACEPVFETKTGAIIGFAGSGVLAAITVYLIVTWPSAPSKTSTAFVAPTGDGAIAGYAGRF